MRYLINRAEGERKSFNNGNGIRSSRNHYFSVVQTDKAGIGVPVTHPVQIIFLFDFYDNTAINLVATIYFYNFVTIW